MNRKLIAVAILAALAAAPAQSQLLGGGGGGAAQLDINTATVAQLKGIGFTSAQAQAIVSARADDPFDSKAELQTELTFATDAKLASLKGALTIGSDIVGSAVGVAGGLLGAATGAVGGTVNAATGAVGDVANTATGVVGNVAGALNVNAATAQQLQQLGFPLPTANKIVAKVKAVGTLPDLDSLLAIPGVNPQLAKNLVAQGKLAIAPVDASIATGGSVTVQ